MKTRFSFIILLAFATIAMALAVGDPLKQLALTAEDAHEYIFNSITSGYLNYPVSARGVAPALQQEVAKGVLEFAKAYSKTQAFKTRYEEWWKSQEPRKPQTLEERIQEQKDEQQRQQNSNNEMLENMRKQISSTTDPSLKKQLTEALKQMEETMKQMQAQMNTPEMKATMESMAAAQKQAMEEDVKKEMDDYNKAYADWQQKKDAVMNIKGSLKQYLEVVGTVNFNAKTVKNEYGVVVFADSEFEAKSDVWKMCYRAGKPVNDVVTAYARQWLTELK